MPFILGYGDSTLMLLDFENNVLPCHNEKLSTLCKQSKLLSGNSTWNSSLGATATLHISLVETLSQNTLP